MTIISPTKNLFNCPFGGMGQTCEKHFTTEKFSRHEFWVTNTENDRRQWIYAYIYIYLYLYTHLTEI